MNLWLWKNGDHYWAFDNAYACHPGGDPMTLGEPIGHAIFFKSVSREQADAAVPPMVPFGEPK